MPSPCNRDVIMNKALSNNVIWLLVAGYFLWVLADSFFHPASTAVSATMSVFFLIAIATLHGLRRYSLKEFLIFFVIAFIVSNFYENLSILTGFPFGHYHYTDALGPKLFLVPLLIAPAYFGMRLPGLVARTCFRWRLGKQTPRRTNLACSSSRGLRHGHVGSNDGSYRGDCSETVDMA